MNPARILLVGRAGAGKDTVADYLVRRYGYGDRLASTRDLELTYPQARQPALFDEAMSRQVRRVVQEDGARAIVMGSTTMALSPEVVTAAGGTPLFLPGMVALGVIEQLWRQGLLGR